MTPAMAANPQPVYKSMRQGAPVMRLGPMVAVSRRSDIEEVLKCPATYSSHMSAVELGNVRPLIPLQIDAPDHVKFRRLLDPLFAPRQMAALEPSVVALVNELIDRFVGRGSVDLVSEFTIPLPSEVFLTLLGLPLDHLPRLLAMKDGIIRPPGSTAEEKAAIRASTSDSIYRYFTEVLAERRSEPRPDLLSRFLAAECDGVKLSTEDILDICWLFLIAGLDTVSASLECFFAHLAQHPAGRRQIVSDPSCIPGAVEELLRWESPVSGVARVAVEATDLAGTKIEAGDQVFALIGSANTDETEFPDADVVDFDRETNRHLAFGAGIHRCLGSHLARLELRVALREFHARIPEYQLAPDTELSYTPGIRSIDRLPLVFN
ncbi:MAG: cytochrome P450 [Acidimicrobiales bacterium]